MNYADLSPNQRKMYQTAQVAKAQLTQSMTAKDVAEWFDRWIQAAGYHYLVVVLMDQFGIRQDYLNRNGGY